MKKLVMSPVYTGKKIKIKELSQIYISNYYWCDIKWGGFSNGLLPFGINDIFALCIFYKEAIGKRATVIKDRFTIIIYLFSLHYFKIFE